MNNKPHDATTAIARRIFEQSKKGIRVTAVEMAKIVEWMEQKDQALSEARTELTRLRADRDAAASQGEPDGYVLVPVEPTPEMRRAATAAVGPYVSLTCWDAMLGAAPPDDKENEQ